MKQKQKIALGIIVFTAAFLLSGSAKADTWTQKYLVDKATSKIRNVDKAVLDTNGNKWFYAYESHDYNGDGFNTSFLYEYSADGK